MIPNRPNDATLIEQMPVISAVREAKVFTPAQLTVLDEKMGTLFDKVITDAGHASERHRLVNISDSIKPLIMRLKKHYRQPRPWDIAREYNIPFDYDPVKSAQTFAYPSGHTTQAHYLAGILARDYPHLSEELHRVARQIELSRLALGVHFPTDNAAGRMLAERLLKLPLTH